MKRLLMVLLAMAAGAAFAQQSPVGLWRNIDDKTGEVKAEIRIVESGGVLNGRIEKRLAKDAKPNEVCRACTDERKDNPIIGLEVIRGAKKAPSEDAWTGGKVLDPDNGKEYTLRLATLEGGQKLQVRGYVGPFFRTQTWVRVQ